MKVALLLTGHMRCWEQVAPNTRQHIIDKYNADVFIETWSSEAYWDPHSQRGITENGPKIDFDKIVDPYKSLRRVRADHYEDFESNFSERAEQFTTFYHVPKNQISMWYKVGRGMTMLEDYMMLTGKTYDLVIRMRPDLYFNEPLPDFDPNKFYTLGYKNHMGQGTSDMIQVGNFFSMSLFCKVLNLLPQLYKETGLLCPHVISEHFIRRLGLPWEEFMINKTIMHTPLGEYKHKSMYMDQKSKKVVIEVQDTTVKQRDEHTFQHHYVGWRQSRINKIESIFGKEFFKDKTVLEMACGYGDIGKYFRENLQSDVTFAEGREEHFPFIRGNNPDCKILHINQENHWELEKKYDVIIHFGVMYHLDNWKQDLECTLRHSDLIILESEIADSNDPTFEQKFTDLISYDQSMDSKNLATRPSAAYVESVFTENGFSFVRYDDADLNSEFHDYTWTVSGLTQRNSGRHVGVGKRRFWVARKII